MIAYGTKGRPGDIWVPEMFKIADCGSTPIRVDLAPKGFVNPTAAPRIPQRFGAYGLLLDLGGKGRQFLTSCVRTFAAEPARVRFPKLGMDVTNVDVLKRLGCKSIRYGVGYKPTTDKDFDDWFRREGQRVRPTGGPSSSRSRCSPARRRPACSRPPPP